MGFCFVHSTASSSYDPCRVRVWLSIDLHTYLLQCLNSHLSAQRARDTVSKGRAMLPSHYVCAANADLPVPAPRSGAKHRGSLRSPFTLAALDVDADTHTDVNAQLISGHVPEECKCPSSSEWAFTASCWTPCLVALPAAGWLGARPPVRPSVRARALASFVGHLDSNRSSGTHSATQ